MRKIAIHLLLVCLGLLLGCSNPSPPPSQSPLRGEYLFRLHHESFVQVEPMTPLKRKAYPWEEDRLSKYPKITKDFFRCKGSSLNDSYAIQKGKEIIRIHDCGGMQRHSLPLKDKKEFIYPILIDLLNHIQAKTGKRVVITCGHCCPDHNTYLNPSPANQYSKHLLGAEVDFYVQGMEQQPEKVVELILSYYREQPRYKGLKEFQEFQRYQKEDNKTHTPPWYNKEIFLKLFQKQEGRDFDNRHPYPYLCIQVRYDWDRDENVVYSWEKAFHQYLRW